MLWFAREIFPLIRRELPDVKFYAGSKVTDETQAPGGDGRRNHHRSSFVSERELVRSSSTASAELVRKKSPDMGPCSGKVVAAIYSGVPIAPRPQVREFPLRTQCRR
ncbi:MAG: hypothetical protein ACLR0U_33050 [Enterocloster clostridioformis]